jgi:hypothetical protein
MTALVCALCLQAGNDTVPAVTMINGTAVCLQNHHYEQARKYVNNVGGPPSFLFIGDRRFLAIGEENA